MFLTQDIIFRGWWEEFNIPILDIFIYIIYTIVFLQQYTGWKTFLYTFAQNYKFLFILDEVLQ